MNLAQMGRGLPKSRLEAFSDGVFAIVITLLVLEIKVPTLSGPVDDALLARALIAGLPVVASCVVSFVMIAVIWVAHHQFVHALRSVDWPLLWLNNLLLLSVIFIPIPTVMIGSYPSLSVPVLVYGGVMTMTGLAFCALRYYASYVASLLDLPASQLRRRMITTALSPIFYGVGTGLAWNLPLVSVAIYVVLPLVYLFVPPGGRTPH